MTELSVSNSNVINNGVFSECSNLESVTFAEGSQLTSIGGLVFYGCSSLQSIEIPAGVTSIGSSAFSGCSSLTSIEIPAGVTSIGSSAFYGCSKLNTVYYNGSIENWFNIVFSGPLSNPLYYGADLYIGGELVTEMVVPESVTTIGYQLTGCTSLTSITIHSGVTSIGDHAFLGCSSLTSIEIPAGVTSIGSDAFRGCSSLASVTFAEGSQLTSIGGSAFRDCSSLTSIEIPAGVTSIGSYAFSGCSNLNTVYYAGSIENWFNIEFENSSSNPLYNGADLYIGGESVTEVVVPESITTIGYQLTGCTSLTSITIHSGVTSIGNYAFNGCSSLTSIEIPAGVTSIGWYAFQDCSSLTSIEIPAGVTSIGSFAFDGCSSLTSIEIPAGVTSIGSSAFSGCSSLTSIEIPAGVTSIGSFAFDGCSSLTSIEIPAGVTSIGSSAFSGCSNLNTVYYAGSIENWFTISFSDEYSNPLYYGADLYIGGESVTEVVVPESVTAIGDYQLIGCTSLSSITIHSGVTSIGERAFYRCSNLESVTFAEGSQLTSIGNYAFNGCGSLILIEIPAVVTSIGSDAFDGCKLTIVYNYSDLEITAGSSSHGGVAEYAEVVLTEDNLANVKDENGYVTYTDGEEVLLLGYLGSEKDIVIPEGVTRIVDYAFYEDDIVSVTLPESLTEIGDMAFNGCYNLKEVYNNSSLNITAGSYDYGHVAYYVVKVHNSCESESIFNEDGFAIVDRALYGYKGSATNIIIPETVTSIARYAFWGNTDIISVSIPAI